MSATFAICVIVSGSFGGLESEEFGCGSRALYTALVARGCDCRLSEVAQAINEVSNNGRDDTLTALNDAARRFGVHPLMMRFSPSQFRRLPVGTVVHLSDRPHGHFLVYLGQTDLGIVVGDAPVPPYIMRQQAFLERWSGNALLLFDSDYDVWCARTSAAIPRYTLWLTIALSLVAFEALFGFPASRSIVMLLLRLRFSAWLVLLALAACGESATAPGKASFPCDILPSPLIDAGFVPPAGKELEIRLVNTTDRQVTIGEGDVKSSCGCTVAIPPGVIPARDAGVLRVCLQGQAQPVSKRSQILIRAGSDQNALVRVSYYTGDLPCVSPSIITFEYSNTGAAQVDGVVWLDVRRAGKVHFGLSDTSALRLEVLNGPNYTRDDFASVSVDKPGLIGARVKFTHASMASAPEGQESLALQSADGQQQVRFQYRLTNRATLSVYPSTINFLNKPLAENNGRIVIVKSPFEGECRVTACPEFVSTSLQRLSGDTWKLKVAVCSLIDAWDADRQGNIELVTRTGDGSTAEGRCSVRLTGSTDDTSPGGRGG